MTPEELTEELKSALGSKLAAVVLYGSAALGEQTKHFSNINICLVLADGSFETLKTMRPVVQKWAKAGNPWPILFTTRRLARATDVFPIEFADIRRSRRVLYGSDFFAAMQIDPEAIRAQLEHELRVKMLRLEDLYFEVGNDQRRLKEALAKSLSSIAAMMRATLRLLGEPADQFSVPQLWNALAGRVPFNTEAFEIIWGWREKGPASDTVDAVVIFSRIVANLDALTDFVDSLSREQIKGGAR